MVWQLKYHCFLRILTPRPTAVIRLTTEAEDIGPLAGEHLPAVFHYVRNQQQEPAGPPFIRFHAFEEPPFELEFGYPLARPVRGGGRIDAAELPGGVMAVTWHMGPYDTTARATAPLREWIRQQGYGEAGAHWNVFATNPQLEPNPARFRSEVVWPISLKTPPATP
jgi:effector-binding domain-containing protein